MDEEKWVRRIRHSKRFFKVAIVAVVIGLGASVVDQLWQSYPHGLDYPSELELPSPQWFIQLVLVVTVLAGVFSYISKVLPEVWKAIENAFGWKDDNP